MPPSENPFDQRARAHLYMGEFAAVRRGGKEEREIWQPEKGKIGKKASNF